MSSASGPTDVDCVALWDLEFVALDLDRIFAHKDVRSGAATPGPTLLAFREDKYKRAILRPVKFEELAKDGDRRNGMWVGEETLEYKAERTGAKRTGYVNSN